MLRANPLRGADAPGGRSACERLPLDRMRQEGLSSNGRNTFSCLSVHFNEIKPFTASSIFVGTPWLAFTWEILSSASHSGKRSVQGARGAALCPCPVTRWRAAPDSRNTAAGRAGSPARGNVPGGRLAFTQPGEFRPHQPAARQAARGTGARDFGSVRDAFGAGFMGEHL